MTNRLERAVAVAAEFLREAREDFLYAAIMASSYDQPRRAQSLSRAASRAKDLSGEILGAWVDARKSEPKVTKLVGATLDDVTPERGRPGEYSVDGHVIAMVRGGEQVTIFRGATGLQMPAATPPEVVDVLFSIARPLDLDESAVWPIESLAREVRELASDAGHNDEVARGKVSIDAVCHALGIDSWIHERDHGKDVARPATRAEFMIKLEGIRAALEDLAGIAVVGARVSASKLEAVEEGLTGKLAERLGEVDPDWLAALVRSRS